VHISMIDNHQFVCVLWCNLVKVMRIQENLAGPPGAGVGKGRFKDLTHPSAVSIWPN